MWNENTLLQTYLIPLSSFHIPQKTFFFTFHFFLSLPPNPRGQQRSSSIGRSSDSSSGSKRLPDNLSDMSVCSLKGRLTAAGLYGTFTRFPFHHLKVNRFQCAKISKNFETSTPFREFPSFFRGNPLLKLPVTCNFAASNKLKERT